MLTEKLGRSLTEPGLFLINLSYGDLEMLLKVIITAFDRVISKRLIIYSAHLHT